MMEAKNIRLRQTKRRHGDSEGGQPVRHRPHPRLTSMVVTVLTMHVPVRNFFF